MLEWGSETMEIVADLHLHSKYSRAVSRDMNLTVMAEYASTKGLDLLSATDWTHPLWLREIKANLEEDTEGIFKLKGSSSDVRFLLSVEISSIYSQGGQTRRIHSLVFSPSIEVCEKINEELQRRGANLSSDGRPIIGLSAKQLLEIVQSVSDRTMLIPAHVWTPWFSLYGSMSGFDSIEECFGEYSNKIYAIETGLSSDPSMNWRIKELGNRSILSSSDSHSPAKMGREATVFVPKNQVESSKSKVKSISYDDIRLAIMRDEKAKLRIGYTVEFYPEEGKYHYTGHRNCKVVYSPKDTREKGVICPVCHKSLTVGVMERVEKLASLDLTETSKTNPNGVKWILDPTHAQPPFVKLVPLLEIIAEVTGSTVFSAKTKNLFEQLCRELGGEMNVLLKTKKDDVAKIAGPNIADGVQKVREGNITVAPGYDGEYGVVKIEAKAIDVAQTRSEKQIGIDF